MDGTGPLDEESRRAVDIAYRALAACDRTEAEMRGLLGRKRVEPAAIEVALEEVRTAGFLDDGRFALRFAEDKRELARWGAERIERELRRRGVRDDHIEAALAAREPGEERGAALALLEERFPGSLQGDRERDRAWRLLVRRGFEPELAYDAVRSHGRGAAA